MTSQKHEVYKFFFGGITKTGRRCYPIVDSVCIWTKGHRL